MLGGWKRKQQCPCNGLQGSDGHTILLSEAPIGRRFKVKSIGGGRPLCARMAAMGIYPGVEMELVCAGCGSPCLVRVHGGTLSLGEGLSREILVTSSL